MARLLRVDSEKLKKLRIKGGWPEPDDFAVAANVSLQTVLRAESNGRNYARNIKKFAAALRLKDWRELLAPPDVQNGLITIEIELDSSKEEAGQLSSLVQLIEKHVTFRNDIKALRIRYGSVFIQILCDGNDAVKLVESLALGRLSPLKGRSISFRTSDILLTGRLTRDGNHFEFYDYASQRQVSLKAHPSEVEVVDFFPPWNFGPPPGWFYCILRTAYDLIAHVKLEDRLSLAITNTSVTCALRLREPADTSPLPTS